MQNKHYDFIFFFEKFVTTIVSNYKIKHADKKVFIAFDHMHISNKFTILLFALRLGKVGIPIWFRIFKYNDSNAFQLSIFQDGISFCHNLFKNNTPDCNIIFLADRFWGNHTKVMEYIHLLGDTYYIRAKSNLLVSVYDEKNNKYVNKHLYDLNHYVHHSAFYNNISFTKNHFVTNLAISQSKDHNEPYYIVTNANPNTAVKEYSKRFGTVEFNFKNEKSNGFFLEETQLKSLKSVESLFVCICIAQILLTILGIDYSKNQKCYIKSIKIRTSKIVKARRIHIFSYFHIGLMIISYAFKMINPPNLFHRIILYDV